MSLGERWAQNRGPYIRMWSGAKVYLGDPTPDQIRIPDVVHHLARIKRYTGATDYTVAQHLVCGANMAARFYPHERLLPSRVLIHDIAEHVIGDVSAPLKALLPDYKNLEIGWDTAVEKRFDLTFQGDPLVKEVDYRLWLTERQIVFRDAKYLFGADMTADYTGTLVPFELDDDELEDWFAPWDQDEAEQRLLTELHVRLPETI